MTEPVLTGGGDLGDIPYLRPHGGPATLERRAARLAALAPDHPAGDFLGLMGRLAGVQAEAARRLQLPDPTGPDGPGGRPLDGTRPPPGWREALALVVRGLDGVPMPAPAREALASLARRAATELDALAGRVLSGSLAAADLAAAPFAGAALQVVFGGLAARLPAGAVPRAADPGCPTCGFPPVAGLVLPDDKLRYLVCGLCGSEWHHTRLQCILCNSAEKVTYLTLEGVDGPAKAEACGGCHAYTKLLYQEKAPALEPFADDLATLALDLLVAERGFMRTGRNTYLATAAD